MTIKGSNRRKHLELVCAWTELSDLVTDCAPTGRLAERIEPSGVAVHVAEPAVQDETVSG